MTTDPMEKRIFAEVRKVDDRLGLVFGMAIVCTEDGEDYYDLQGDHIPEETMLKAATDFMLNSRVAKEMHDGEEAGVVLFCFPMTAEAAKAYDMEVKRTGLMIGMKPSTDEMLQKFQTGEYSGFSIGGVRLEDEEV